MRRQKTNYTIGIVIYCVICLGVLLDYKWVRANAYKYCATPPFITAGVKSNVLIILDNSNSMDEDFYGNAVGSYASSSKSVVAKKAIRSLIDDLKGKLRVGLMTYRLPEVHKHHIHNSPYFVSYEPKSYCPSSEKVCLNNPSQTCSSSDDCGGNACVDPCVVYCQTGDRNFKSLCESKCRVDNPLFDPDYFDEIIGTYSIGSEQRNRYCRLVYPKAQRMVNPKDAAHYVYYKHAYPFYDDQDRGVSFCYSTSYNPHENTPWDSYSCYGVKEGTSDGFNGYSSYLGRGRFYPTDSDKALGYLDFGRRLSWTYVGKAWFSNTSPGDGYLHVEAEDLVDESGATTITYEKIRNLLDPKENDESGYMSCGLSNKNKCPYIVNAGLTPTAGTFQTAIDYFEGRDSPIQVRCQKNFVVYVTDGLPSVDENGNSRNADELMPAVLEKIRALRNITKGGYSFDIKTYVLGVGLSDEAKEKLDQMAVAGGTDKNGHAYYADNPEELISNLGRIFTDILKKTSSGTSTSVLSERTQAGATMLQALFYPEKSFSTGTTLHWIGYLNALWLYKGSAGNSTSMREDTVHDYTLDLLNDYIIHFSFEEGDLIVNKCQDTNGDGLCDIPQSSGSLDDLRTIFEAGEELQKTTPSSRRIYTIDGIEFSTANEGILEPLLLAGDRSETEKLIRYIRGEDFDGWRSRTVDGSVWKLGDIVYSTPQVVTYDDFAVIVVGANDGMLHAFKLGKKVPISLGYKIVQLEGSGLGEELWAYIPSNVLPYLRYLKEPDYCHLYYVDLTPFVFTYNDHKILIGGMRFGGACNCTGGADECVTPPSDANGNGLSAYFALDITDPYRPRFLWEFTDPSLGFSYSGPAVLEVGDHPVVVFLSGPTHYNGVSTQNLKVFVLTLDPATFSITGQQEIDTGERNAFGGRLFLNKIGDDPAVANRVFFGYVQGSPGSWSGGVYELDFQGGSPTLIEVVTGIGPVTAGVREGSCDNRDMIYFAEGRYFSGSQDDPDEIRRLYGVLASCRGCSLGSFGDSTSISSPSSSGTGWYIKLKGGDGSYNAERSITDPLVYAGRYNVVFFTTFQPTADVCGFGGRTYEFMTACDNGGLVESTDTEKIKGKLFLQVSTGQIKEFTPSDFANRRSEPVQGVPSEFPPAFVEPYIGGGGQGSKTGEIIHWLER